MSIHADIGNFMSIAWEAANAAGAIIRENWQQPKTIDYKGAIDLRDFGGPRMRTADRRRDSAQLSRPFDLS